MKLTPRLIAAAVLGTAAFLAPASAQITLTVANAGFETAAISPGFPSTAGVWGGDQNTIVAAGTVSPFEGSKMLSFVANSPDVNTLSGTSSDTFQIVDMAAYASSIAAGGFTVTLSAYYNRSGTAYSQFTTAILAFNTTIGNLSADLTATNNQGNARAFTDLISDANTGTWEQSSVSLTLPTNTKYILVEVSMVSGVNSPNVSPTGYFADNITLTAVPEPSTYALLAGMGTLGAVVWRRRTVRC